MKIYRVIDDATEILVTTDRLKMLEVLYKLLKKYPQMDWFWIEENEL